MILLCIVFTPLGNLGNDSTTATTLPFSPLPDGNGYTYSRSITIDHTKVPNTDQTNFPVLISGTYSYLATVANGGRVQNSNGYDIIFTSDSGCVTKLNHEVETYNASTGAVRYWVKVPTVFHATDSTLYMCYGNSGITADQSNPTGVWDSNFTGVYHLGDGTTLNANDSTSNANNGTATSVSAVAGPVAGGASFNGSTSKVDLGAGSSFDNWTALTLSGWFKFTAMKGHMFGKWQSSGNRSWILTSDNASEAAVAVENPNHGVSLWYSSGAGLTSGVWYHIVVTWSQPNTVKIYVNGVSQSISTIVDQGVTTTGVSTAHAMLGQDSDGSNNFNGVLDEMRASNVVRSADWVTTEYNNQSSPATFYSISAQSGNQPPVANAGGTYTGVTGTAVQFSGSSSSDPDGTIASYTWNYGDGNSGSGATPTHTYATAGTYTVTLTVTDNLGATNSASTTAAISNRAPVANAGAAYTGVTGTAVQLSGSSSSDPDGSIASYSWNYGDGNAGTVVTPTHTYATAGTYTVTLTVTDNLGATASATASTTVTGTLDTRLDPLNRTGGGGEDPLSRNFNWSIPLVGLPGRSGLDLGLSLAYNSLATWTRNGNAISFDDDHGSPAPGFRLGFPVIQGNFYNSQAGKYSFIMFTPSGSHVELRQVGASTLYQSVDSSYVLLDASNMKLLTTDGTQLSYAWKGSDYECTEIKDRNGNFITINYDSLGRVDNVIDTLSRTIHFNYDTNGLSSITQTWAGQTHYWARFTYTNQTIQTNFTALTVYGPSNNSTIHALTQVKLADDSHFDFDYTTWGQVWKISQYTGETSAHLLNYRSYNLPIDNSTAQTDCPRFTVRHDWAENWNRDTNGAAQEVNTSYAAPVDAALPDNSLAIVTRTQVTLPDGTSQKIYFAGNIAGGAGSAAAWKRGLPLLTDTFESGNTTPQRSATTTWTQDDTSVAYPLNPRVTEANITDPANNHARTRTDYASTSLGDGTTINLPVDTYEYQSNATTVLRRTHIVYNVDTTYTGLRIIGLPSGKYLCDGAQGEVPCTNDSGNSLLSKVTFEYDESGSILGTDAPVQHDNTNYTAGSSVRRGNLSSVTRHDVVNTSQSTTSIFKYNTAGAVVATLDPLSHGVTVSYADSFSADNNSRNTLAYPTTVTDAGGFSSSMKYNYDFGAATRKQTPLPNVIDNQPGPVQTIEYDSLGRLQKVKNLFNNAYTRYEYQASQTRVDTYATIQDNAGEAHSFKITDGRGRVIASAADHPGSTGGYSGQLISYDTMGRVIKQSNPTETSASSTNPYDWAATGDDATSNGGTGWLNTQQTYDWKGRPLVTTNTDNTYKSASYGGCGCAGSQVITLTDEVNRQQKIYSDVLGRQLKTEILNTDLTVYSTTTNTFNARDQVTLVRQYQGADTSTVYQDATMSYDGYGRLLTKHDPEQQVDVNNSLSTDHTTWSYNDDDTLHTFTDARGVTSTFGYNSRRLLTSIGYPSSQVLPSSVPATADSSYSYDAAGNRISMSDGVGGMSYQYNDLSQLTSETRTFSGSGAPSGSYGLSYQYNLGGELKKITDSTNMTINYGYDKTGRLNGVTGSDTLVGGVSNYASGFQYRAWGSLKQISAGNSHTASLGYNARLQVNHFDISGGLINQNYDYFNDGRLSFVHNTTDNNFDRSYNYDHAGRLTAAATGGEARHDLGAVPMYETFAYNAWDKTTTRVSESWLNDFYDSGSYTNGRRTGWGYDADGRITSIDTRSYTNDASGRNTFLTGQRWTASGYVPTSTTSDFDGDGKRIRETSDSLGYVNTIYYLRSSVLGRVIVEELNSSGQKQLGYVYTPAGGLLASQAPGNNYVSVRQVSPIGASQYEFSFSTTMSESISRREFDPVGANVPLNDHTSLGHSGAAGDIPGGGGAADSRFSALQNPGAGCVVDGVYTPCDWIGRMLSSGSLALAMTSGGKTTKVDLQDFGIGLYAAWVADQGQRLNNHPTKVNDEFDEHDTIVTNTEEDNLGHLEFLNINFALPQNYAAHDVWLQTPRPHPDVEGLLQNPDCEKFLNGLLNEISKFGEPYSRDFRKVDAAAEAYFRYHSYPPDSSVVGGTPGRIIGDPYLEIFMDAGKARPGSWFALEYIAIHETIHAAATSGTGYTHEQMAIAAYNVAPEAVLKSLKNSNTPGPPDISGAPHADQHNSELFNQILWRACPPRR